ncbi:PEP-CTERM sorting domain-containing protein [Pelagibius marinus]|uniref:PEP-CTERM sorting domain-containing protein n=1 Tax=Pelagibius marinus TaxID=2762760 RepID=UPI0018724EF9|nr:PEP-CTERM sorting domain-containing protein [Pelagibius marinus]
MLVRNLFGALFGVALLMFPLQAHAVLISHNGTDGFYSGSEEVDVYLNDYAVEFPGSDLFDLDCGSSITCIYKRWDSFSEGDVHDITFTEENSEGEVVFFETVFNFTEDPWSDYHVEWEGELVIFLVGLFAIDGDGNVVDGAFPDFDLADNSLDIYFDFPFIEDIIGEEFSVGLFYGGIFAFGEDSTFVLSQYPTLPVPEPGTAGLFLIGLVGLSVIWRRRRKQDAAV